MEDKRFLEKDRNDTVTRLMAEVRSALYGIGMERTDAYEVRAAWIDDAHELQRASDILDDSLGDTNAVQRPEECSGFLGILSDERRLLRDTKSLGRGHKLRMFDNFALAYKKLQNARTVMVSK